MKRKTLTENVPFIEINGRRIGKGYPTYVVAEMSANHNQSFDQAVEIVHAAGRAGADAVKLQTYTPDTITIDCGDSSFQIPGDNAWAGRTLYDLYGEAYTPWDWQPRLKAVANEIGLALFSAPFDATAVDFLEDMGVPAYKVASFEIVDLPLIRRMAGTGKPIIMSTGMATLTEIEQAVQAAREAGCGQIVLLKCTSSYPAPPEEMNLVSIPHLSETFQLPVGLSDHTLGTDVPLAGVALGACLVEKHFTLSRSISGPDSAFSLEPAEMSALVGGIRTIEKALGKVDYSVTAHEQSNRVFRRSLFVTADMNAGEVFTEQNVRSIRPGYGLEPRYLDDVLGKKAARDIKRGTPLAWDLTTEAS